MYIYVHCSLLFVSYLKKVVRAPLVSRLWGPILDPIWAQYIWARGEDTSLYIQMYIYIYIYRYMYISIHIYTYTYIYKYIYTYIYIYIYIYIYTGLGGGASSVSALCTRSRLSCKHDSQSIRGATLGITSATDRIHPIIGVCVCVCVCVCLCVCAQRSARSAPAPGSPAITHSSVCV